MKVVMPAQRIDISEQCLWQITNCIDLQVDAERALAMVDVNMKSTVSLTQVLLPGMISRKRGLVVNMSSGAALFPNPLIGLYSASKVCILYVASY